MRSAHNERQYDDEQAGLAYWEAREEAYHRFHVPPNPTHPNGDEIMTATLLEISDDMKAFASLIDECGEELTPEMEAALNEWFDQIGEARDEKLDNYAALIRTLDLRAAARKEEKERLAMRVRVDENAVKRLKDRLLFFFELQGLSKVETRRYSIRKQKNGGKVPMTVGLQPEALPKEFQRIEIKTDTDKLYAALSAGTAVEGCRLEERGQHMRIA